MATFIPDLGSRAQDVQPLDQTRFFRLRCSHWESDVAALGVTWTDVGESVTVSDSCCRFGFRIGPRRFRVSRIWHSTV